MENPQVNIPHEKINIYFGLILFSFVDFSSFTVSNLLYFQNPTGIYLFKTNNENIKKVCKICSKLTIKTSGRGQ